MINKRQKGTRVENLARKKLQEFGYLVAKQNYSRFGSKDFYGHFDLIAIKGSVIRFIQIKSVRSDAYKAIRNIQEWKISNNLSIRTEVWTYMKAGKWIIEAVGTHKIESFAIDDDLS